MDFLSSCCTYTLRHSDALQKQAKEGGPQKLTERRVWRTGSLLWVKAKLSGERMPVVFSGADDTQPGLIYWATIDDITVDDEKRSTTCCYSNLRPISPLKPLSALRLLKSGRQLSDADIRPYRICQTPRFLV